MRSCGMAADRTCSAARSGRPGAPEACCAPAGYRMRSCGMAADRTCSAARSGRPAATATSTRCGPTSASTRTAAPCATTGTSTRSRAILLRGARATCLCHLATTLRLICMSGLSALPWLHAAPHVATALLSLVGSLQTLQQRQAVALQLATQQLRQLSPPCARLRPVNTSSLEC